jgi:penicillin-binding protein-related factor A (putative recombinase)
MLSEISKAPLKKEKQIKTTSDQPNKTSSSKIGNAFEKEILNTCALYKELKLAYIQKEEPPVRWIPAPMMNMRTKKLTSGILIKVQKAGFDFVGCYKTQFKEEKYSDNVSIITRPFSWSPVFFEVKTTKEGRIDIWRDDEGIKTHQIVELQLLEEMDIEAFILWQIRDAGLTFKFTISQMINIVGEKKSLSIVDCEEAKFERCINNRYQGKEYLDFLRLME